uniref:Acyl-CoA binding domain containing 4 n=1 Tax=Sinocyclocheilus rhinocerous TaxID=307959 RepID=A0A673LPF0_9TELE
MICHLLLSEIEDCQRRFQAAVDVIQSLPKNGSYRPSYEVMLRFYALYKVCGPCTVSHAQDSGTLDAWNQLGEMSRESAMAAYVDEMKEAAQEVIDTMQINEKPASFFHYFEPLYYVIHDMPRPPEALLSPRSDVNAREPTYALQQEDTWMVPESELQSESTEAHVSEVQGLASDSESEIFCDSLEQLDTVKLAAMPDGNASSQNGHALIETTGIQVHHYSPLSQVIQIGAGHGGEGAEDRFGPPIRRRTTGREGMQQGWRNPSGQGGRDNSEGGPDRLQNSQVQQQIILAIRQLREDMQKFFNILISVLQEKWWPFDISGRTLLLLLVWPFVTQALMFLLRWRKRKINMYL